MTEADRARWNARYAAGDHNLTPNPRLVAHLKDRLRPGLIALDIACGPGRNLLWLARNGVQVHGWDISDEALALLKSEADREGLEVHTLRVDLDSASIPEECFDLVIDTHFLHRPLLLPMLRALRPGGLLFIDVFLDSPKRAAVSPPHRIDPGELARVYAGHGEILHHQEDPNDGRAVLLIRRPAP